MKTLMPAGAEENFIKITEKVNFVFQIQAGIFLRITNPLHLQGIYDITD